MPPIDSDTLVVLLWGLTAVLLGWTWLPALIAALGGTQYRNGGTEDTAELEPKGGDPDYRLWYDPARELGYLPVGSGWMRVRFAGTQWQFQTGVRAFYSPAKRAYFFLQFLPSPVSLWLLAHLATPLADGGILLTMNYGDEEPNFEADSVRQGKRGGDDIAELEILHAAALEVCRQRGRLPDADGELQGLLDAAKRNWGPEIRSAGAKAGWNYLLLHVIIHACASIPAAEVFGFEHIGVPVTNLVLWLLMAISSLGERQAKAAIARAAVQQSIARRGVR